MKLSTKKNRFPHTFSKARALECNYSANVTRPCPASSGAPPITDKGRGFVGGVGIIDLSPRMRVYFRWGQKCALFRTAPIVAVERRRYNMSSQSSCDFYVALFNT